MCNRETTLEQINRRARLTTAAEIRHVATALEFEQIPRLSQHAAVAAVLETVAHLRRTADGLMADERRAVHGAP